jgi:WD40 repeat protein
MTPAPPNPFRLLESYTRQDRESFFGRDTDLTLILDRILTGRTTLLFAASGVGKTSFLKARVVPDLEDRFFVAYHDRWTGAPPSDMVAASVVARWNESAWGKQRPSVAADSDSGLAGLYRSLEEARDPGVSCSGSILVLDQFETVFQQHGETEALSRFVRDLATLIKAALPDVRVVLSMREEFLGELSVFDNQIPDLFNNYYRLKDPSRRLARTIIAKTIRTSGVAPDPRLDDLVEDLAAGDRQLMAQTQVSPVLRDSVPPPFLQIACHGLWEAQFGTRWTGEMPAATGVDGAVTFPAAYRRGGAAGHLHQYARQMLSKLSRNEQFWLSEALGFLITRRGAKLAYEAAALAEHSGAPEPLLRALLDRLTNDAKLFRRTVATDGSVWYELYHDMYSSVFSKWRTEFQKGWRARRNRQFALGATAIAVALIAFSGAVFWQGRVRSTLEAAKAGLQSVILNTPLEEYQLRFGRHAARVMDVAFSPDGSTIATASFDKTAKIWDAAGRLALDTIQAAEGLQAVAFHPDAGRHLLALGGANEEVALYDWKTKRTQRSWTFGKTVYSLAFSADGNTVACGGDGGQLWLFHLDGRPAQRLTLPSAVNAMAFTPDGKRLVFGDFGGGVRALTLDQGSAVGDAQPLGGHALSVLGVAVSGDGRWMASGSRDRLIHLLDGAGKLVRTLAGHTSTVRALAFSPDSRLLASAGVDGTVRLWDVSTGGAVATLLGHVGAVFGVSFSPSGKSLASSGQDSTVRLWDIASRKEIGQLEGEWAAPQRAQFSLDLSRIITERSARGTHLWTGAELDSTFGGDVTALALTPDTKQLVVGRQDGGVTISSLPPHGTTSAPTPDTTRLAVDGSAPTWREGTQHLLQGPVHGIVVNGTGETMAVVSNQARSVLVINRRSAEDPTARTLHTLDGESSWFVALNATGDGVALANQRRLSIFDRRSTASSAPISTREAAAGQSIVTIVYDVFQRLMVLYDDYAVDLINGDGRSASRISFGARPSSRAAFAVATEDGRTFAFADAAGHVYIWPAPDADARVSPPIELRLPEPIISLAFARDGKRLATMDRNGTVRVYAPFDRGGVSGSGSSW